MPWITIALIAANVIVFAWEIGSGADLWSPSPQKLFELGGNLPSRTLDGQWWRLGSAMFMHAGVLHIGMNMFCLWQARSAEDAFGRAAYATLYIVSGLLGGIATALRGEYSVSVGASGAVFGVYGAFFAFLLMRRDEFQRAGWDKVVRQMGTFLGINLVFGFTATGIDMSAHLGGLAAGALGAAALLAGTKRGPVAIGRTAVLGAVGLAIVAGVILGRGPSKSLQPAVERFPAVEKQCMDRFNQLVQQIGDRDPTPAEIDQLDREVLAPWKQMRAELDAEEVPDNPRAAAAVEAIRRYFASRQKAFETLIEESRAPAAQQQALGDRLVREWKQSDADGKAAAAALEALDN
jgi:rhomboid protease GluP